MKNTLYISIAVVILVLLSSPVLAADKSRSDMPWAKGYVNLGAHVATFDSTFRLGLSNIGIGIDLDVEDFLGLTSDNTAFRVDVGYRLGKSMRHKVDFSWFRYHREGEKVLTEDVELPPELGGETLPTGKTVSSIFNFDIYKLKYKYSFFLDDRVDLNAGIGAYVMPLKFGLGLKGQERTEESITAPLPVIGLGFDFAFTPKWFLRQSLDLFYLEMGEFRGSILNAQLALEYLPWKHLGFGAGIDALGIRLEAQGGDYPGIDFNGAFQFAYVGAQLYAKLYF